MMSLRVCKHTHNHTHTTTSHPLGWKERVLSTTETNVNDWKQMKRTHVTDRFSILARSPGKSTGQFGALGVLGKESSHKTLCSGVPVPPCQSGVLLRPAAANDALRWWLVFWAARSGQDWDCGTLSVVSISTLSCRGGFGAVDRLATVQGKAHREATRSLFLSARLPKAAKSKPF